jgi:hypothetical protein
VAENFTGEQPIVQQPEMKLSEPDMYPGWIVDVLKERAATGMVPELKNALRVFGFYSGTQAIAEIGVDDKLQAILETLRREIAERTKETVSELNKAMRTYAEMLPATFIQTEEDGEWQQVEGFSQGDDFTIDPIINGEAWAGVIYGIKQESNDDE